MQVANVNVPITVTARNSEIDASLREYAEKKVESLHLDYPRITEAKVILDVQKTRHMCEIVLFCANHITIDAKTETTDLHASIDETVSKIARRMRKFKTRMMKRTHRPRKNTIRHLEEQIFNEASLDSEEEKIAPVLVHKENYKVKPLYPDEAIMDLEMSDRPFIVFTNEETHTLCVLYRREDGEYGMVEPKPTNGHPVVVE